MNILVDNSRTVHVEKHVFDLRCHVCEACGLSDRCQVQKGAADTRSL